MGHISPTNMRRVMPIFSLLKMVKFYLIIAQWQIFSVIIFDQLLKTLTYLNEPQFNISDETDIAANKFRPHHSIIELKQKFSI